MISILLVFAVCGPGQKKSAAEEKATEDSIAKAAQYPMAFETFFKTFIESIKGILLLSSQGQYKGRYRFSPGILSPVRDVISNN